MEKCPEDATGQQRKCNAKLKRGVVRTQASKQDCGTSEAGVLDYGRKGSKTDGAVNKGLEV